MNSKFYTNYTEVKFIDKIKYNLDHCERFCFSVSFIKKAGLKLLSPNIEAALARGAKGRLITSTYQNFTDIESLRFFDELQGRYPNQFECRLDIDCFHDSYGNINGFHSKGYLFEFQDHNELLVGSSNITLFALLKNIEWDVSIIDSGDCGAYEEAKKEFEYLWQRTNELTSDIITDYQTRLYYSIERWDMDYSIANSEIKPNYMQKKALKELNRIRALGATKALVCSAAGSGKTVLAAFDVLNFNPKRMLYIVQEGSILMKSYETFQRLFGSDKSYGIYNKDSKELDADFVFSTNITMANNLELFDRYAFDYCIIDECHHATADTYKKIIDYFEPEFLLGITATPERMDGNDVFSLFDQNVPYELRLRDAIVNNLVVPFHYYGIRDELIEYGLSVTKSHKFIEQFSDEEHCEFIYKMIEKHRVPSQKLKAIAFCKDVSHAIRMSQAMSEYYKTQYLTGKNTTGERIRAYRDLQSDTGNLEILFTVDILNEGVDIPGVNMVLFLRPTESQTIFIQQLGRGLRKYEGKSYVTVLDFIANDYKRSVQIAFALGSLSENFVVEKKLVAALVQDDYKSLGLQEYGVEIHLDDLSKKEILSYIDNVNFNTKIYLEKDYINFKKYTGSIEYPSHIEYLNNDFAPDLMRFMQSKVGGKKCSSYYGFLKSINEQNIPVFDERQEGFVKYLSELLPLVRTEEYLIVQRLMQSVHGIDISELETYVAKHIDNYSRESFDHAVEYMMDTEYFVDNDGILSIDNVAIDTELTEYVNDLIEYGLRKYSIDFGLKKDELFLVWQKYRKGQVQQLLCKNPGDIMLGTKVYGDEVFIYVTVVKGNVKSHLDYDDGYIDAKTFQWESVANIKASELNAIKNSRVVHVFVRKVSDEDGIRLPFTYIGEGKAEHVGLSKNDNGAHIFRMSMKHKAPEDIFFDFKLRH